MLNNFLNLPGKEIKALFSFIQPSSLNDNPKPSIKLYSGVKTKQVFWKCYNAYIHKLKYVKNRQEELWDSRL